MNCTSKIAMSIKCLLDFDGMAKRGQRALPVVYIRGMTESMSAGVSKGFILCLFSNTLPLPCMSYKNGHTFRCMVSTRTRRVCSDGQKSKYDC